MYDFTLACFERALQLADDHTSADVWYGCAAPCHFYASECICVIGSVMRLQVQYFARCCGYGRHFASQTSAIVSTRQPPTAHIDIVFVK